MKEGRKEGRMEDRIKRMKKGISKKKKESR
jgi:hypothetical protein